MGPTGSRNDRVDKKVVIIDIRYEIDGIHLDNCQAWPNIMKLDIEELYRV